MLARNLCYRPVLLDLVFYLLTVIVLKTEMRESSCTNTPFPTDNPSIFDPIPMLQISVPHSFSRQKVLVWSHQYKECLAGEVVYMTRPIELV